MEEFELLEKAAQEMSFSSQCSLVARVLEGDSNQLSSSSPKLSRGTQNRSKQTQCCSERRSLSLSPVPLEMPTPTDIPPNHYNYGTLQPCSHSSITQAQSDHLTIVSKCSGTLPSLEEDIEEEAELDSTLKQQSGRFGDEEIWESFTEGTPRRIFHDYSREETLSQSSDDCVKTSGDGCSNELPVSFPDKPVPVRKVCVISDKLSTDNYKPHSSGGTHFSNQTAGALRAIPLSGSLSQSKHLELSCQNEEKCGSPFEHEMDSAQSQNTFKSSEHFGFTNTHPSQVAVHHDRSYSPDLPPPSALVAKLFPSLRKNKEAQNSRYIQSLNLPKQVPQGPPAVVATPPQLSAGGSVSSSDVTGIDDQVKRKLMELEQEIARFKAENAALENLRKEREEVHCMYMYMYNFHQ